MSDYSMTVRCAERFGFEPFEDQKIWELKYPAVACKLGMFCGECIVYNPLQDDEQAYRLIKNLGLQVSSIWNVQTGAMQTWCVDFATAHGSNPDLNRAIVECVAQLPKR